MDAKPSRREVDPVTQRVPPTTSTSGEFRGVSRRGFLATGAAATLTLAGCLGAGRSETLDEVSYRYRFSRNLSSTIIEGNIELGTWEEEGLDVTFGTSSGADAAAQSVANGNDEFAQTGIASAVGLIEKGAPIIVIGQTANPLGGVISLAESGIESWRDLEGKAVGHFPFGIQSDLAMAAFRSEGGDVDEVELRNIQPGSQEVLLMEGEVDAVIAYWPQSVTRLEHRGYEANHLVTSKVLGHLGPSLITHESMVEDEPDLVTKFVRGWLNAHQLFVTDIDELIEIHKEFVEEFDEAVERETLPAIYASRVPAEDLGRERGKGWTPEAHLQNTLTALEDIDYVDETASPGQYYTNRFIEDNQELAVETAAIYYDALEDYDIDPTDV